MAIKSTKEQIERWEAYRDNLMRSTPLPVENEIERRDRIAKLEKNSESWFAYYFPAYYSSPSAPFHRKATDRLLKNNRWYEVRRWSRELAKSTRGMMEDLYMAMTGKARNFLLVSHTYDNAEELLMPYLINLESNARLINDYGTQKGFRQWEMGDFVTRNACSFRAIGAGQSPRGTRNEAVRPDVIRVDDIDTDERCRNEKRVSDTWDWVEQALIPTVSVSGNVRIVFQGNLISKNSIIARASEKADHVDTINIRDKNGKSTWPDKNTEAHIDWLLSKISYNSVQKEYYNNPIIQGTVFKEVNWGACPKLSEFKFLVAYGDPAPSNKENKSNCYKALFLMGQKDGKFYILTGHLEQIKNAGFVQWYYDIEDYVRNRSQVYNYIENNTLQDPFYEQVFQPLFFTLGREKGHYVHITPDDRKKPDKFARIEGNLEPLNRQGRLIFNQDEKTNPHMMRLEDQFKNFAANTTSHIDGPDAVEGGVFILNQKTVASDPPTLGVRKGGAKKF
jgi:hypothetical protein